MYDIDIIIVRPIILLAHYLNRPMNLCSLHVAEIKKEMNK